jgi:predicted transcriptional regulator
MAKPITKEMKRISVALDDKTDELLEDLVSTKNMTVSDIVRMAIVTYSELENNESEIDMGKLKEYAKLLYGGENVIVDIDLWTCILDELNERGSEKIWKRIETVGEMYGSQFRNMGTRDIRQILRYLEATNWFRLKTNGSSSYVLVLRARNEGKLLKLFLQRMFEAMEIPVEITKGLRKITISSRTK